MYEVVRYFTCSLAKEEEDLNLLEWYFIVAYCVGGALVVAGLVVVLFVCWLARDQCCERIAKKKPTRMRVRRSKVNLGKYVTRDMVCRNLTCHVLYTDDGIEVEACG